LFAKDLLSEKEDNYKYIVVSSQTKKKKDKNGEDLIDVLLEKYKKL